MKTIFFKRIASITQALWVGLAIFFILWGFWLLYPPAVVGGDQTLATPTTITLLESGKR